jgi:plastocyanin
VKHFAFLSLLLGCFSLVAGAAAAPKEIDLHTEKKDGVISWQPDTIEVTPGEKIKIVAKNDLEGGADFHGLIIPELKVNETVNRGKTVTVVRTIPKNMKPGEYKIACQFHPKHVPAKLVVKEPETEKKTN